MKKRSIRLTIFGFAVITLGILLSGCGKFSSDIDYLSSARYPAQPDDAEITITEGDLDTGYTEIAMVTTKSYDDRMVESAGRAELRRLARKVGGDAIINMTRDSNVEEEWTYRPGNLLRSGMRFTNRSTLSGIVVRLSQ
jgi:hypothetical protein